MNRKCKVYFHENFAGILTEEEDGYKFEYEDEYIMKKHQSISLTLPITGKIFFSKTMFPFFDGLIPEGWLLNLVVENWKIDPKDRMGLLSTVCEDCIGAVSIKSVPENSNE